MSTVNRAEVYGADFEDLSSDITIWDLFKSTAAENPSREAIVSLWQPADLSFDSDLAREHVASTPIRWTYEQLLQKTSRIADSLESLGGKSADYLVVVVWNCAEWGLFFWVAAKLDMTFVPLDPRDMKAAASLVEKLGRCVLVAQDGEASRILNQQSELLVQVCVRIQCSGETADGWKRLETLDEGCSNQSRAYRHDSTSHTKRNKESPRLLVFTSGTTGEPKGCSHTDRNLVSQLCDYDPADEGHVDRWLVHTPTSHIFAINNSLRAWRYGGTVVFPSKSFEVGATLNALKQERCTIMSATPSLVKAILAHPSFTAADDFELNVVTIAGTMITSEDIQLCREVLGCHYAVQAYGMSEGAPLVSWARRDEMLHDGYHAGVGKVLPGAAVRICEAGGTTVLNTNEVGELHISGSSVINGYWGGRENSSFYDEAQLRWFKTGDQASIDDDGVVHLLGRYKDLIIRGGENIQPGKIEHSLTQIPGLEAYVVGIPDDVAGQVPVAVVKLPVGVDKQMVAEQALKLGSTFALSGIYTLDELDLERPPMTALGKVKKNLLQDLVLDYRERSSLRPDSDDDLEGLIELLANLWEDLMIIRPRRDEDMLFIADSITLLRFCDVVGRKWKIQLYLQDIIEHPTVAAQAKLLRVRDVALREVSLGAHLPPSKASNVAPACASSGPRPASCKAPHASHTPLPASDDPRVVNAGEVLRDAGLLLTDLEDIIPIRSSLKRFVVGQRPKSFNVAVTFRIAKTVNGKVREAVHKLIAAHPLLRAMLGMTKRGEAFLIIAKHSSKLPSKLIMHDEVDTSSEAIEYAQGNHGVQMKPYMFRAVIVRCQEDGYNYLSLTFNHAIMDALSVIPWNRDLDSLLQDLDVSLPARTPYAKFAGLIDHYSTSEPAQEAILFHVKRLRGISLLRKALWPVQRAPGWMMSSDSGSAYAKQRATVRESLWKGRVDAGDGNATAPRMSRVVGLPQMRTLESQHGITPMILAKAAIAMLNVIQTGSSHAIFTTWESGRSWPFLPKWIEEILPPAMSIDGPTVEWVLQMMEVNPEETVLNFLQRVSDDHQTMKKYEHAPWSHVMQGLQDEGTCAEEASFRQSFVWDVSLAMITKKGGAHAYEFLEPVNRHDWADCGVFWNACMMDKENMYFIASWDTAQMTDFEMQDHCETLAGAMRNLAAEMNWGKTIKEVFDI